MHKIVVCLVFVLFMRIYSETTINYKVLFIFDAFRSNLEPLFLPFKSNFSFCSLNIYLRAQTMGYVTSKNRLRDPSFLFFIARWLRDLFSFLRTLSSDCVVVCVHESYTVIHVKMCVTISCLPTNFIYAHEKYHQQIVMLLNMIKIIIIMIEK